MSELEVSAVGIPPLTLGWRLQMALGQSQLTAQQMADELGVTRQTLSRWMHDVGAPPRPAFLRVWSIRTGVPYRWLAEGVVDSSDPASPDPGPGLSHGSATTLPYRHTERRTRVVPLQRQRGEQHRRTLQPSAA